MNYKLSASEALYGFCGWLTARKEKTVMSSDDNTGCVAALVEKFCEVNDLEDPREDWVDFLKHPKD